MPPPTRATASATGAGFPCFSVRIWSETTRPFIASCERYKSPRGFPRSRSRPFGTSIADRRTATRPTVKARRPPPGDTPRPSSFRATAGARPPLQAAASRCPAGADRAHDEAHDRADVARGLAGDALELRLRRGMAPADDATKAVGDQAVRLGGA